MSRRMEKVSELIKRLLSEMFQQTISEEFGMVTIIDVYVAPDLKTAEVYIAVSQSEKEKAVIAYLENHKNEYHSALAKSLEMRYTPRLKFKIDQSLTEINKVEEILENIDHGS